MNILNFEISKKTEEEINEITKNFKRTVEYADISETSGRWLWRCFLYLILKNTLFMFQLT